MKYPQNWSRIQVLPSSYRKYGEYDSTLVPELVKVNDTFQGHTSPHQQGGTGDGEADAVMGDEVITSRGKGRK
jgi:hypothetical protein